MHVLHTFANNSSVPYLTWFAERAAREGSPHYTFLIMYHEPPAMVEEMRALGFACEWIRYDPKHRRIGMLNALPQLWRHMKAYRPDIVHCNLFDDALPGILAATAAGIPVRVVTRQDTGYHWMHARRWMFFDRQIARLATDLIAISSECHQFVIEKEAAPEEKVHLVPNGIPPDRFTSQDASSKEALRTRFNIQGRWPVIGTVARFIEWKGHRFILDAAARLVERHPRALFLLCGEGDLRQEMEELVQQKGLQDHVVFTGWVDREMMPSFYGILDIYLHAAVLEPFGLVYAEAMMNGVPVVSTATGAALDGIDDGVNGFLVERSGEALASGVERALASDLKTIGEAGRRTAMQKFHFDRMWEGTMQVYHQAMRRHGR